MTQAPLIPENAPFTAEQRAWLNGFLAGLLNQGNAALPEPTTQAAVLEKQNLLVLFGSQSGNAESFSKKLARQACDKGFAARAAGLDAVNVHELTKSKNILVVTSTWGEGDMPDNAASFWDALNQNGSSPKLDGIRYSVLALGDQNYGETFCLAGRKLDQRLAELGATRIAARVDCDVDFEEQANAWTGMVFEALAMPATPVDLTAPVVINHERDENPAGEMGYSKKRPFPATLIANMALNAPGSAKATHHIAFSLTGSGLAYEAGDALGVFVKNCPDVVDAVITAHGLDANACVALPDGGEATLREAMIGNYEVRHLLGVQPAQPVIITAFVESLRKLQPRLYSIASSPKAHPEEVHLTVGAVHYKVHGQAHKGVASTFLSERLVLGHTAGVFLHAAKHFRLPADRSLPVIMVGPGTGIAPFRAFLEEREATHSSGKNWLFFGDQHRTTDFLYHDQIIEWVRNGHLTRLDTAFSRDQEEKLYVQTRMSQAANELWQWLEDGAHFYVCGDAKRMAKDVDATLHEIIQTAGGRTAEEAAAYVASLKKHRRYQRDVY